MNKFEVGKIYANDENSTRIRVVKRTNNLIWFDFVYGDKTVPSTSLGYKFKKVKTLFDSEWLWLDIGWGQSYSAKNCVGE